MKIVQHGIGDCAELLRVSQREHAAYALRHNATLIQDYGRRLPERPAYWEKIPLLLEVMRAATEGELIVWLDADCLIVRPDVSMAGVLQDADFGLTKATYTGQTPFYNTGVMFIRNTSRARAVLHDAQGRYPNPTPENVHPKHDERAINESFNDLLVLVQTLAPEWNSWHRNKSENPIVKAWHGTPETTVRMRMAECLRQRPS